jgi:hypothetical protein
VFAALACTPAVWCGRLPGIESVSDNKAAILCRARLAWPPACRSSTPLLAWAPRPGLAPARYYCMPALPPVPTHCGSSCAFIWPGLSRLPRGLFRATPHGTARLHGNPPVGAMAVHRKAATRFDRLQSLLLLLQAAHGRQAGAGSLACDALFGGLGGDGDGPVQLLGAPEGCRQRDQPRVQLQQPGGQDDPHRHGRGCAAPRSRAPLGPASRAARAPLAPPHHPPTTMPVPAARSWPAPCCTLGPATRPSPTPAPSPAQTSAAS